MVHAIYQINISFPKKLKLIRISIFIAKLSALEANQLVLIIQNN